MFAAAGTGFIAGFSLILAIGAQNAFVLRQGLLRQHVFLICLICAVSDALLIAIGVAGAGILNTQAEWLVTWLRWGGAAFLIVYGGLAARRALSPGKLIARNHQPPQPAGAVVLTVLALTFLNPHVYLDTVGLLGAISLQFGPGAPKLAYAAGAMSASFVFFFGLGYGARLLAPILATPRCWAVFEGGIALVMWSIAASLITGAL